MVEIIKAGAEHIEIVLSLRLKMLKVVNGGRKCFDGEFIKRSREFFLKGDQSTVLAYDGETAVGCATICYVSLMPTFDHPDGRRAHIMNVYTKEEYRRQGIAGQMMNILLEDARVRGVTYADLDATDMGKPLYETLGFSPSDEYMRLNLLQDYIGDKQDWINIPPLSTKASNNKAL